MIGNRETMTDMFHTECFDFTLDEVRAAVAERRLLATEVEFNRICNYRCPYCYADDGKGGCPTDDGVLTSEEIDRVIDQVAELGARKVVILGGEPLLYRGLEDKLARIDRLGMRSDSCTPPSPLARRRWDTRTAEAAR